MNDWLLDLRQYRYFLVLGEELHYARAAERLGISQPALSQQISSIEAQLRMELFVRKGRRIQLTDAGLMLLGLAANVVQHAQNAERSIAEVVKGNAGKVSIAYVASAALSGVVPRSVYDFRQYRPLVQVSLQEMDMLDQVDAVVRGDIDVGFIRPPVPDFPSVLACHDVLREPMVAVLRIDHPLAENSSIELNALKHETFICTHRRQGVGFYEITMALCQAAGFKPRTEVFAAQTSIMISMVAAGFGVSLVPASSRFFAPSDVCFVPLSCNPVMSRLSMIYAHSNRSPSVRVFVQTVADQASIKKG